MSISRTTVGWLFADDFNRADGAPGANWSVQNGTVAIATNQLRASTAAARAKTLGTADRSEILMQGLVTRNGGAAGGITIRHNTTRCYYIQFDAGNTSLFKLTFPSTYSLIASGGGVISSQTAFKFYSANSVQKLWRGTTLLINQTNADFNADTGTGGVHLNNTGSIDIDDIIFMINNTVKMTGLPTGYKLRVGSVIATESGGTATVDVGTDYFPRVKVEVLDASSVLVEDLTPTGGGAPDGVWGGDIYLFTPATPPDAPDILSPAAGQVIDRQLLVTCEDVSGTGSAGGTLEYKVEHEVSTGAGWTTLIDWTSTRPVNYSIYTGAYATGNDHRLRAYARRAATSGAGTVLTFEVAHPNIPPTKPTLEEVWHADKHLGFRGSDFESSITGAFVGAAHYKFARDEAMSVDVITFDAPVDAYNLGWNKDDFLDPDEVWWGTVRYEDDIGLLSPWADPRFEKTSRVSTHLLSNHIRAKDSSGNDRNGLYVSTLFTGGAIIDGAATMGFRFPINLLDESLPFFPAGGRGVMLTGPTDPDVFNVVRDLGSSFIFDTGGNFPKWSVMLSGMMITAPNFRGGIWGFRDNNNIIFALRMLASRALEVHYTTLGNIVTAITVPLDTPFVIAIESEQTAIKMYTKFGDAARVTTSVYSGAALPSPGPGSSDGVLHKMSVGHDLNGAANAGGSQCFMGVLTEFAWWWDRNPGLATTELVSEEVTPDIYWKLDDPAAPDTPTIVRV